MASPRAVPSPLPAISALILLGALFLSGGVAGAQPTTETGRQPAVELRRVAGGFAVPVFLTEPADGTGRLFVVDQVGHVRVVEDGELRASPFLDVSDRLVELDTGYDERGLLGLAFHPGYADNGRFFVYYSAPLRDEAPEEWDHTSRLSEFRVSSDDPNRADPGSERVLLEVDQPFRNHNAGHIVFGLDGHLYVPLGDGGNGGDVDPEGDDRGRPEAGNGQTTSTLLGSILRLDVDGEARASGRGYAIPDDNPFVGEEPLDEIWAYGFRNPYGLSVDLETGDLYAADAGQALYEELNLVERGGNFGWNIREGTGCFDPENFLDPPAQCSDTGSRGEPLVEPVVEYRRGPETGSVIVAGIRYRGEKLQNLRGQLLFADYGAIRFLPSGILYTAEPRDAGPWKHTRVHIATPLDGPADGDLRRWALGVSQDLEGEAYLLTTKEGGPTGTTGEVFALEPVGGAPGASAWWRTAWIWLLLGALAVVGTAALARAWAGRGPRARRAQEGGA